MFRVFVLHFGPGSFLPGHAVSRGALSYGKNSAGAEMLWARIAHSGPGSSLIVPFGVFTKPEWLTPNLMLVVGRVLHPIGNFRSYKHFAAGSFFTLTAVAGLLALPTGKIESIVSFEACDVVCKVRCELRA